MFEVQILIPVVSNDGVTFSADHHAAFETVAIDLFNGVTRFPSQAVGSWVDAGRRYDDATVVYGVAVKSIVDGAKVGELVAFAKRHYRQESIFIRYLGLAEIIF